MLFPISDSAASLTPEQLARAFEQFARASDALTRSYEALQAREQLDCDHATPGKLVLYPTQASLDAAAWWRRASPC